MFLELLLIIANIGTAIVIYALVKRVNEVCAIGYVTARVMECTFIIAVLGVVGLRESPPSGSDARSARSPTRWPRSRTGRSCSGRAS